MRDLDTSACFYETVLGFEAGQTRETTIDGKRHRHTPLWRGPVTIGLGTLETLPASHHLRRGGPDAALGLSVEICVYVKDGALVEFHGHVRKTAETHVGPLAQRPWGVRDFRVVDPDGYYIRITAPDRDFRS